MLLTPKNWSEFQHYKDRKPAWIKLHRTILDDYQFSCLPVASRALAPCLWLLASEYDDGNIAATEDELAFRLRISKRDLLAALEPLISSGFFIRTNAIAALGHPASTPLALCKPEAILEREREKQEKIELLFEEFWKRKPKRKGSNPRPPALKAYLAAARSGCDLGEINLAASKWASEEEANKTEKQYVPMAATWLHQRRFEDYRPSPEDTEKEAKIAAFMRTQGKEFIDGKGWVPLGEQPATPREQAESG